jgi:hypothetical protein
MTTASTVRRVATKITAQPMSAIRRGTALGVALLATAVLTGSPAQALDNNGTNLNIGGYGVAVAANVFCDKAARTMTVSGAATVMQANNGYGPVLGPYDNGQWLRYRVLARDIKSSGWSEVYSWSQWSYIKGFYSTGSLLFGAERSPTLTDLGPLRVTGSAGHNYEVMMQVDWWTTKDNVANVPPTYTQNFRTDAFNTYPLNTSNCSF